MKAAVVHARGAAPRYEEFPDPVPAVGETVVRPVAIALENVERALVAGEHFAAARAFPAFPAIAGHKGVARTEEGRLVGFGGVRSPYGAMAEQAPLSESGRIPVPEGVDPAVGAAVVPSLLTSLFPLKYGGRLAAGGTVLVNGATGFSGRLAVQVARRLGARRVVGTGRDPAGLEALQGLGADVVVDLARPEAARSAALREAIGPEGVDVVLDYLWGAPTEEFLRARTPGEIRLGSARTTLVQLGEMAGASLALPAEAIRTSGVEIVGMSAGASPEAFTRAIAEAWDWVREGRVRALIERVPLRDIETAWSARAPSGTRVVVMP